MRLTSLISSDNRALSSLNLADNCLALAVGWKPHADHKGWFSGPNDEFVQEPSLDMTGIITLAGTIKDMRALTKLDISDDYFPGAAVGEAIGNMLAGNRTIKDLDISKCCIDAEAAQEISLGLSDNEALTSLDISNQVWYEDWDSEKEYQ
jgi:hypothetical protein